MGNGAPLRGMLPFGLDRNRIAAEDVDFSFGERLLEQLAAFGRWSNRIEHAGVGNSRLGVIRDELVPIRGDTDPGIAGLFSHDSLEDSESSTRRRQPSRSRHDTRSRPWSGVSCLRTSEIIRMLPRPPIG